MSEYMKLFGTLIMICGLVLLLLVAIDPTEEIAPAFTGSNPVLNVYVLILACLIISIGALLTTQCWYMPIVAMFFAAMAILSLLFML